MCKMAKKVTQTTETDEAGEYDEDHEFGLNTASWIDGVDDSLNETEEVFYDCLEVSEIESVSCDTTQPEDILGSSFLYHTVERENERHRNSD